MVDRPPAGRAFFEGLIRDHLDIGRSSQVALILDRTITRRTPGTFRTKVITKGVDPQLVELVSALLDAPYGSRQATDDLRRLTRKGLIQRLPGSQRYLLTPLGRRVAVLFTKAYGRVLAPGLAVLDPALPAELAGRTPLAVAWRGFNHALDSFIDRQVLLPET